MVRGQRFNLDPLKDLLLINRGPHLCLFLMPWHADVVIKPLTGHSPVTTTYMLHHAQEIPAAVLPFMKLLEDN